MLDLHDTICGLFIVFLFLGCLLILFSQPDHYINGPCAGLQFTAHPKLKRRLQTLKRAIIGTVVVIVAIPIVLVVAGIGIIVILVAIPIYAIYRLIKFLRRKLKGKKKNRKTKTSGFELPDDDFSFV